MLYVIHAVTSLYVAAHRLPFDESTNEIRKIAVASTTPRAIVDVDAHLNALSY